MPDRVLAIKVDVDTDRGTRVGVPNLLDVFGELGIKVTFLFALGPDNTGRAIKRIFRSGFLKKVQRTNVIGTYGWRTLINGVLVPGPHIGRRNADVMRAVRDAGHEAGIHCYDHVRWQDGLATMSAAAVRAEFGKAQAEFERVFGARAATAGAAGWQANALSLAVYDEARLDYASDARGAQPFFPRVAGRVFETLQVPTTLPTLDELLGRPDYPEERLLEQYVSWLLPGRWNVLTVHAEIEGMSRREWFRQLLHRVREEGVRCACLRDVAVECLKHRAQVPVCDLVAGTVDGRSGTLAVQALPAVA